MKTQAKTVRNFPKERLVDAGENKMFHSFAGCLTFPTTLRYKIKLLITILLI